MSFESGTFALTMFWLPSRLPEDYLQLFSTFAAGKIDDVRDEPAIGWVSGRHLLENEINEVTAVCGGHPHVCMRTAERKIPPALLKAICRREELDYMQANDVVSVPSKIKKQIKADVVDKHLMKMPPQISGVSAVVDDNPKMLYLDTGSTAQVDNFVGFFMKTIDLEPIHLTLEHIIEIDNLGSHTDLQNVSFAAGLSGEEPTPARDFLTWLWYHSEKEGGGVRVPDLGEFELMIDGPLTLAFAAEAKGAAETTVKKGSPLRSAEAKAALSVGKKLKKAKIVMAKNENMWTGMFDADKFSFSGFALPDGEEMEPQSRFAERVQNLHFFQLALRELVKNYVNALKDESWLETERKIQTWTAERDSL